MVGTRARRGGVIALTGALCLCMVVVSGAHAAGISIAASAHTHQSTGSTTIAAGPISTTAANDVLVAFIASDGPGAAGGQSISSVVGGGLAWKLRQRTNAQPGTAEIWEAVAPTAL